MKSPAVKRTAEELGLEVLQIDTLRSPGARLRLSDFSPDMIVVAAFGLLLPKWVLELSPRGCVNLHASLLPRFRGASPISAAIACGDARTGVTLMHMERGLDTGAVYAMKEETIRHNDTTESLTRRLSEVAADVLLANTPALISGTIASKPQEGSVVETRKVLKAHGAIEWRQSAEYIERHVRAMWPWPRAWTEADDGSRIQVHVASLCGADTIAPHEPGTIRHRDAAILVATGDGWLKLERVQLPGKNVQPPRELLQHPSLAEGRGLGASDEFEAPEPWIVYTEEMAEPKKQ